MSIFSSFTSWLKTEWTKMFNAAPSVIHVADTVLKYAVPAISIIVGAEAGAPAAAIVASVGAEAQKDLLAVSGLIYDFGANPTTAGMVTGVQNHLSALLSAGHISNAGSVANVTKVVNALGDLASHLTTPAA
jgi:hypothetical protein